MCWVYIGKSLCSGETSERELKAGEEVKRKGKAGSTIRYVQNKLPQLCVQTSQKTRHPQKYDSPMATGNCK